MSDKRRRINVEYVYAQQVNKHASLLSVDILVGGNYKEGRKHQPEYRLSLSPWEASQLIETLAAELFRIRAKVDREIHDARESLEKAND